MKDIDELVINGVTYVRKEEKPKREPIKAWAHVFDRGLTKVSFVRDPETPYGHTHLECVQLHELPPDSVIVTRKDALRIWNDELVGMDSVKDFLEVLGFKE